MGLQFWSETGREFWPRNPANHLFLGRAIDKLHERFGIPAPSGEDDADIALDPNCLEVFILAAEAGVITCGIRCADGQMVGVPAHHWNGHVDARFLCCRYNPKRPFAREADGDGFWDMFAVEAEFEDFLDALSTPKNLPAPPAAADIHLSPYMKMMIAVIRRQGINPTMQSTKESIMSDLENMWPADVPKSQKLLSSMATLIREPDSQKGSAKGLG